MAARKAQLAPHWMREDGRYSDTCWLPLSSLDCQLWAYGVAVGRARTPLRRSPLTRSKRNPVHERSVRSVTLVRVEEQSRSLQEALRGLAGVERNAPTWRRVDSVAAERSLSIASADPTLSAWPRQETDRCPRPVQELPAPLETMDVAFESALHIRAARWHQHSPMCE